MNGFEIINTYSEYISARIDKQKLEDAGIFALLKDEHTVTMNWMYGTAIGGIKLMVHESELMRAQEVLELDKVEENANEDVPPLDIFEELELPSDNKMCPRCNSKDTMHKEINKKSAIWSILIVGFPLAFKSNDYHCFHCGHEFKVQ